MTSTAPSMTALALALVITPFGAMAQSAPSSACVYTLAAGAQPQCPTAASTGAAPATVVLPTPLTSAASPPSVPVAPTSTPAPAPEHPRWELRLQDVTLAAAFTRWAQSAGWRVLWDVDKHLLIDSPDVYLGSFEQVLSTVLMSPGLMHSQYPLEVCFYPNTPPLARITRRGEQKQDCK